jgi:hypothetical protein
VTFAVALRQLLFSTWIRDNGPHSFAKGKYHVQVFSKLLPYTLAGFDLAILNSSFLGGRRRRDHTTRAIQATYVHTYLHVTYVHTCYICTYMLHFYIHVTYVHTCYIPMFIHVTYLCSYMLHMYIHVTYVHTCYLCTYMLPMYIHVTYVHTCYICTYMLHMYIHVTYVQNTSEQEAIRRVQLIPVNKVVDYFSTLLNSVTRTDPTNLSKFLRPVLKEALIRNLPSPT